ncbi:MULTISPECIES: hypothetical protein [unclassified Streptomyces]|uniref:hypothetical protein n=1 Tax=unclassified Streptomyces TaxID=2593676 RepID=UPI000B822BF7|nr:MULTISPECIES: hypothetical protein [unclassified Streptomyces]MYZ38001.1 hypothetical protein [Streptomyces sp. SID4917]
MGRRSASSVTGSAHQALVLPQLPGGGVLVPVVVAADRLDRRCGVPADQFRAGAHARQYGHGEQRREDPGGQQRSS